MQGFGIGFRHWGVRNVTILKVITWHKHLRVFSGNYDNSFYFFCKFVLFGGLSVISPPLNKNFREGEGEWLVNGKCLALFNLDDDNCSSRPLSLPWFSLGHDWSYSESPIVLV